jgi:hypothetical protein
MSQNIDFRLYPAFQGRGGRVVDVTTDGIPSRDRLDFRGLRDKRGGVRCQGA